MAARASLERKKRAFRKAKQTNLERDVKIKNMQRRMRHIPTCSWKEDQAGENRPLLGGPHFRRIQLATSHSNIEDIRVFVLSSMASFTTRGGVALLLETISRIHGKGVIARMMQRARNEAQHNIQSTTFGTNALIRCTCEERQKQSLEKRQLPPSARNDASKLR